MFTVVAVRDGRPALEFTPLADSVRFSTSAVGGFGAASFRVPGIAPMREIALLTKVQLRYGTRLLWEGRVEDAKLTVTPDAANVDFTCFGYRRLLEETTLKRVWLLRSINWSASPDVTGLAQVSGATPTDARGNSSIAVGQYDQSDLTKVGVKIRSGSNTVPDSNWAVFVLPNGITLVKTYFTYDSPDGGSWAYIQDTATGTSWTTVFQSQSAGSDSCLHTAGASRILVGGMSGAGPGGLGATFWDMRILCSTLDEDEAGGIYGHRIINDVISLVSGIDAGDITPSSEFAIPAIGRAVRDSALSVIDEVAAYYQREWGVWEDQLLHWTAPGLDNVEWIIPLGAIPKGLELESSVDGATKSLYLLYEDAATGQPFEVSSTSTSRRNPYVRTGAVRDEVFQAPVVMTSLSAQRLTDKLIIDRGSNPATRGRITLNATDEIEHAAGGRRRAFSIRGGENVVIPDLPKDDFFRAGREGQTVFRVVSSETNMEDLTTTLELEGYGRRSDILMARVTAVTRSIGA